MSAKGENGAQGLGNISRPLVRQPSRSWSCLQNIFQIVCMYVYIVVQKVNQQRYFPPTSMYNKILFSDFLVYN